MYIVSTLICMFLSSTVKLANTSIESLRKYNSLDYYKMILAPLTLLSSRAPTSSDGAKYYLGFEISAVRTLLLEKKITSTRVGFYRVPVSKFLRRDSLNYDWFLESKSTSRIIFFISMT